MEDSKITAEKIMFKEKRATKIVSLLTAIFILGGLFWIIFSVKTIGKYSKQVEAKKSELLHLNRTIYSLKLLKAKLLSSISQSNDSGLKAKVASIDSSKIQINAIGTDTILKISANYQEASIMEQNGFDYLLKRNIEKSIEAFANAEEAYLSFHNVYEIHNYLVKHKDRLSDSDSDFWKTMYIEILKKYSWNMPDNIKKELLRISEMPE